MAHFMTRVVLHGKNHDHPDYNTLHNAMEQAGFSRQIKDETNGKWYHLPPAEYSIFANAPIGDILKRAVAVADKVTMANGVLVTEGFCTWDTLLPA
ncbi:DUF2622 domain-containing protein [Burkholderia gladioli]|uniref:DUF2622 domain-containing protein n=1 Tax=Burkholderia gladioli TaxID=28095 RepID=UPI00164030EC|nr:DUF2622 domain-containing protein [Burkholderia gladioli]